MCICAYVSVRACVRACVRVRVCVLLCSLAAVEMRARAAAFAARAGPRIQRDNKPSSRCSNRKGAAAEQERLQRKVARVAASKHHWRVKERKERATWRLTNMTEAKVSLTTHTSSKPS